MTALLDTHFLLWLLLDLPRIAEFPWLERYRPWGISPASLLELQFLSEIGRIEVRQPELAMALARDSRFIVDEVGLVPLIDKALTLSWTRDPFDRLLAAHSEARRTPLCTLDRTLRREHRLILGELR